MRQLRSIIRGFPEMAGLQPIDPGRGHAISIFVAGANVLNL
jgi:hypothetical protein